MTTQTKSTIPQLETKIRPTAGPIGQTTQTTPQNPIIEKFIEGYTNIINFPTYAKVNYYDGSKKYKTIAIGVGIGAITYFIYKFYKSCKDAGGEGRSFVRGFVQNYWVPVLNEFHLFDLSPSPLIYRHDPLNPALTWHYSEYEDYSLEFLDVKSEIPFGEEDSQVPPEVRFLMQATHVLGQFDKSAITDVFKLMETVSVAKGEILFTKGDPDDQIYILIDGLMEIYTTTDNKKRILLKKVRPGGQLYSILSFVDVITDNSAPIKTVEAVAVRNSTVLKIPSQAFRDLWLKDVDQLTRSMRRLIRRVYQVVFVALHKILGLTTELVKQENQDERPPIDPAIFKVTNINIQVKEEAIRGLLHFFKLTGLIDQSSDSFMSTIRVLLVGENFELLRAGTRSSSFLYVHKGEVEVSRMVDFEEREEREHEQVMFYVTAGEGLGGLPYLTDDVNIFNVKVPQKAILVVLAEEHLEELCERFPVCILPLANSVVRKLSSFARQIDFGIEWVHVDSSSQPIYKGGDEADCTYLVLCGRLRSILNDKGKKIVIGEYGRNDWIGLVETLTKKRRSKTVLPIRDSELAKIPEGVLHMIKLKFPIVTIRLLDFLGNRVAKTYRSGEDEEETKMEKMMRSLDSSHKGCSTVTLLPTTNYIPLFAIAYEIFKSYEKQGSCRIVSCEDALNWFGGRQEAISKSNDYLLASWLSKQEEQHRLVIYIADYKISYWSLRCTRQADIILILANADEPFNVSDLENMARIHAPRAKKELVLLHKFNLQPTRDSFMPSRGLPKNSRKWLEIRRWLSFHHHIKMYPTHLILMYENEERVTQYYEKEWEYNIHSDIARLTRWISGKATGLVLGGGGAKGAAHVGMIKAILEHGIPIDLICGVSIGAFVGGLFAGFQDITRVDEYCKDWFLHMTKWYQYVMDMTVPVVSILEGEAFNESLKISFQDIQIEDLWLPYFCLSTDVTGSGPRIHKCGPIWRYCRASMTLAGYFPPLCDPIDGHLLMDGGYTNLVPANIMREFGARFILAIDVSCEYDSGTTNYGDHLSGMKVLFHKFLPFLTEIKVPNLFKLQSQLSFIQSALYLDMVKKMDVGSIYLRPPIDQWTGGDFTEYKEIQYTGYRYATEVLQQVHPGDTLIEQWISMNPRAPLVHDKRLAVIFTPKKRDEHELTVIRDPSKAPSRARSSIGTGLYELTAHRKKDSLLSGD